MIEQNPFWFDIFTAFSYLQKFIFQKSILEMFLDLNRLRLFNKRVRLTPNFKEILVKNANDF
jgi:hypothetical protein